MTKLLIPLIVIFVIAWLWRSAREQRMRWSQSAKTRKKLSSMVPCVYCGVHVPQETTVQGAHGTYCCEAHLRAAGDEAVKRK